MVGHLIPATGQSGSGEVFYAANGGSTFGVGNYIRTTSTIYNAATSKGTFSCWVYFNSLNTIFDTQSGTARLTVAGSAGVIKIFLNPTAASNHFIFQTNATPPFNSWVSILVSWDTNFSAGNRLYNLYINDAVDQVIASDIGSAFSTDYSTTTSWTVGNNSATTAPLDGDISNLYLNLGVYTDFSILANRRKFISATRRPVFLGTDGSIPSGSQPLLFFQGSGTGFNVNSGSASNFTTTGTLTVPTTTPSAP